MKTLEELRAQLLEKFEQSKEQTIALQGAVEAIDLAIRERDTPKQEEVTNAEPPTFDNNIEE